MFNFSANWQVQKLRLDEVVKFYAVLVEVGVPEITQAYDFAVVVRARAAYGLICNGKGVGKGAVCRGSVRVRYLEGCGYGGRGEVFTCRSYCIADIAVIVAADHVVHCVTHRRLLNAYTDFIGMRIFAFDLLVEAKHENGVVALVAERRQVKVKADGHFGAVPVVVLVLFAEVGGSAGGSGTFAFAVEHDALFALSAFGSICREQAVYAGRLADCAYCAAFLVGSVICTYALFLTVFNIVAAFTVVQLPQVCSCVESLQAAVPRRIPVSASVPSASIVFFMQKLSSLFLLSVTVCR